MNSIGTDIWQVRGRAMRMPIGVRLPIASTVLRVADGSLLIYSPIRFDDEQVAAIDAAGRVSHIVAPSLYHHLYAAKAAERWPGAMVHGAPGLATKRRGLKIDRELGTGPLDDSVDVVVIGGVPRVNEAVLFHRPSGTLVCADLFFNITKPENVQTRFVLSLTGVAGGKLAVSRMWGWLGKDRAATRAALARVVDWPIRMLTVAHGDAGAVDSERLRELLARHLRDPSA